MKFSSSRLLTLTSIGFLTLAAAPAVLLAKPQYPPEGPTVGLEEATGGLAATDKALGALGRLADMPELPVQKKAINAYNRGLEQCSKARKLEEQAATTDGEESAARKRAKAQKSYKKAIGNLRTAVEQVPDFHQALGSLGFALLETGQYQEALAAYNRALATGPGYPEAIAERGEVYLGLDRIEEAKGAFMQLFEANHARAAELMTAMRRWLDQRRGDPGALSEEAIESFAVWIEEHSEPVAQVGTSAGASGLS